MKKCAKQQFNPTTKNNSNSSISKISDKLKGKIISKKRKMDKKFLKKKLKRIRLILQIKQRKLLMHTKNIIIEKSIKTEATNI